MNPRRYLGDSWRHPITRAVVKAFLTIWVTTTLTFLLIRLMPGSPVELKIDELIQTSNGSLSYEEAKAIASSLFAINLNAPIHEQYLSFIWNLLHLDIGSSFLSSGTSVTSIISPCCPGPCSLWAPDCCSASWWGSASDSWRHTGATRFSIASFRPEDLSSARSRTT
jgi:ABC-type dipeptide/oligopeptide/nickel transport system permease component